MYKRQIKYWADRQIFLKEAELSIEDIYARARQTSYLVPGLTLVVNDNRTKAKSSETFFHKGGIGEFCTFLRPDEPIGEVIRLSGTGEYTETVPVLDDKGHMMPTEVAREMGVDIALQWGNGYDTTMASFVNIISTCLLYTSPSPRD